MKLILQLAEYGFFRCVLLLCDTLPYSITCLVARGTANLWWLVDKKRRIVARDNIIRSGIETDPKRALAIAKKACHNMALVIVESLRSTDFLGDDAIDQHLKIGIPDDVNAVLEDPEQSLIIASGHYGNWEVAGHWLSRYKPVAGITRAMNNPYIEGLVKKRKSRYRFRPIPKHHGNTGRFLEVLDNHEILALLFDQHAGDYGIMIDFFGHPAATFKTAAMLHLVTRTPLCFASCHRVGPMKFEINFSPLIQQSRSGNKNEDIEAILSSLNRDLENTIRQDPAQYLWGHRRWRD